MVPQKTPGAGDHQSQGGAAAANIMDSTNPHANAHPFFWSGPTFSTGTLEPLAEVEIVLVACFTQHGVYDINRWRLAVQVIKAQRKAKRNGTRSKAELKMGIEAVEEQEEHQSMLPPVAPQGVGKGFIQMPNLAHYIQVS